MYTIKQTPDDFIVEEQISFLDKLEKDPTKLKSQIYYKLTKKNTTTLHALSRIASALFIEDRQIGFCGLKDKNATTSQYISLPNYGPKTAPPRVTTLTINNCKLEFIGSHDSPLFLGNLSANKFTINVDDTKEYIINNSTKEMINYFGEQRFSQNNAQIGHLLVKKKFLDAVNLILSESAERADRTTDVLKEYIAQKPNDAVGGLRRLNPQHIKLYMHALQSQIWNEVASQIVTQSAIAHYVDEQLLVAIPTQQLREELKQIRIPLLGFDYEEDDQIPQVKDAIKQALKKHNLTLRDFIVKEFPELTKSGGIRELVTHVHNLEVSNLQENSATFTFTLEKGAYATIALRHILIPNIVKQQ